MKVSDKILGILTKVLGKKDSTIKVTKANAKLPASKRWEPSRNRLSQKGRRKRAKWS